MKQNMRPQGSEIFEGNGSQPRDCDVLPQFFIPGYSKSTAKDAEIEEQKNPMECGRAQPGRWAPSAFAVPGYDVEFPGERRLGASVNGVVAHHVTVTALEKEQWTLAGVARFAGNPKATLP